MTESFGARLRQQRERQHVELASIADRTKISLSLLEGLERDDLSNWPAGIFRRSFIRVYAQNIGLEPASVVREFQEIYPDPTEVTASDPTAPDGESTGQRPPTRLGYLIGSAISSLRRTRQVAQEGVQQILESGIVQETEVESAEHPPDLEFLGEIEPDPDLELVLETTTGHPEPDFPPDLSDVARLCTEFCRVLETRDVAPLLEHVAELLDAVGLIVWVWDPQWTVLKPALAHGYSDEMLAKLPRVRRETDNATAASFRSAQTLVVKGDDQTSGAVVVPLMTPAGCTGVFAVELQHGREQRESVRALATIFAAQLSTFVGSAPLAEAVNA